MHPRLMVALSVLAGYLALAFSVHNLYPISTFEMYAGRPVRSASRVIARDAAGALHEIDEYRDWQCPGPLPLGPEACPAQWPYSYTGYLDRAAAELVAQQGGSGGDSVDVVRRVWRLSDEPGPPPASDCLLERCRAVRR
jgi:hypothetical protein